MASNTSELPAKAFAGNSLWLGTSGGSLLRTDNQGLTWSFASVGLGTAVGGLAFSDALHGLAYEYQGGSGIYDAQARRLARTSDGGQTWALLPTQWPAPLTTLKVLPGTGVYVGAGSNSLLATTTDDGDSWQTQSAASVPYRELAAGPAGQLWASTSRPAGASLPPYGMLLRYTGTPLATTAPLGPPAAQAAYPNPTTGPLTLARAPGATVRVHDALGRQLACPVTPEAINLSAAPAGLYFLTVTAPGGASATQCVSVVR